MAISAEQLNVILSARDREFTRAMERAQRRVERFSRESNRNLNSTSRAFGMLINAAKGFLPALSAGAVVAQMRRIVSEGNRIATLSQIAGTTAEEFQRFAIGAQTVGFDMDKTADIIKDVNDKIGDFLATGAGPMADFFENIAPQVGVTADQFARLSGQEALMLYVRSLEAANLSQAEMTFYMEAIANDATALLPLLMNNAAEMRRMGDAAAEAGQITSNELAASAREAEIQLLQMSGVISGNLKRAFLALAPLLVSATGGIANLTTAVRNFFDAAGEMQIEADVSHLEQDIELIQGMLDDLDRGDPDALTRLLSLGGEEAAIARLATLVLERNRLLGASAPSAPTMPTREISSPAADLSALEDGVNAQRELARLAALTAQERERARIEAEADALVSQVLAQQAGSAFTNEAFDARERAAELREEYIAAATAASSILNPVKAVGAATRDAGDAAMTAAEQYEKMLAQIINASPALQGLGFNVENLQSTMQLVESSMEDAFMSMVDGTMSAQDAFKSMAASIVKELFRVLVVQRLVGAITGALGFPSSAPIPGAASGRSMQAGQPHVVGEHGRELFVPQTAGRVLSVAQAQNAVGGGGSVVVNQTINVSTGVQQTVRNEIKQLMPQIAESAKSAVVDAKRRGGSYGRAFS
jgi:undecaprenyl pyrophosphate synthase